jgi:hypothetical protein
VEPMSPLKKRDSPINMIDNNDAGGWVINFMNNCNFDMEFDLEKIGLALKYEADKKIYDFSKEYLEINKNIPLEEKVIEIVNVLSAFYLTTNIELLKLYNQHLLKYISNFKEQC